MGGHSHWTQIKRQKWANDAKRGQLFSKLSREIAVAVRQGGPDPELNPRLRLAIERAKDHNMPAETIERAIKKASGAESDAARYQEVRFEGFGPGGVAIVIDALTDNRNRTVAEIRQVLTRNGGNLGESGSVSWQFEMRGSIVVQVGAHQDPDQVALAAIDAGAEDVKVEGQRVEVYTQPSQLSAVREALQGQGYQVAAAEVTLVPKTTVQLDERTAVQVLRLLDALEDLDDVQRIYSNAEFPEAVLVEYASH